MASIRKLLSSVAAIAAVLGIQGAQYGKAQAQETNLWTQAELACEAALREGTIEALEEYIRRYPNAPTACRTLAFNALADFAPQGGGVFEPTPFGDYGG